MSSDILRLFTSFPNHSILMSMIEKYFKACLDVDDIGAQICTVMLPVCMKEARSRENVTLAAQSMRLIVFAKHKCFTSALLKNLLLYLPGYRDFVRNELHEYSILETSEYGGPVPVLP